MQWNGGVLVLVLAALALAEDNSTQTIHTTAEEAINNVLRTTQGSNPDYREVQANDTSSRGMLFNSTETDGSEQEARVLPTLQLVVSTGTTRKPYSTTPTVYTPRPTRDYTDYTPYPEPSTRRPYPPWPHLPPYYSYPPHYYPQPPSYYPPYYPPYRPPYGYPGYPGYGYPGYPGYGYPYYPYGTSNGQSAPGEEETAESKSVKLEPTESSKGNSSNEEKSAKSIPFFKFLNFG